MSVSGAMVEDGFTHGWALIFGSEITHVWRRAAGGNVATSACRSSRLVPTRLANGQTGLFYPGDYPRCKTCQRIVGARKQ